MSALTRPKMMGTINDFKDNSNTFEPFAQPASIEHMKFGDVNWDDESLLAEQFALLNSIEMARDRYRIVSLGAAPGEWVARAERAYNWRHPAGDFQACSVEGDQLHYEIILDFLKINRADLSKHTVKHAVVAEGDGFAYFPIINSATDWGAGIASFAKDVKDLDENLTITAETIADREAGIGGRKLEYRVVEAISLAKLLCEIGQVNFLHCDIQGAEQQVFPNQMPIMSKYVSMACVSTHSNAAEEALSHSFKEEGWILKANYPCRVRNESGRSVLEQDGIMIWINNRLTSIESKNPAIFGKFFDFSRLVRLNWKPFRS